MKTLILSVFVLIILISACKKNKDVEGCMDSTADNYNSEATVDDGSCTYTDPYDPTCDGHQTNTSIYPLIIGAKWRYDQQGTSSDYFVEVVGTTDINGTTYYEVDWSGFGGQQTGTNYYRYDTNGDVLTYFNGNETIEVPADKTVGYTWSDSNGITWEVTDDNASVTGASCSYTGCYEFTNNGGVFVTKKYYKEGLGLVKSTDYSLKSFEY